MSSIILRCVWIMSICCLNSFIASFSFDRALALLKLKASSISWVFGRPESLKSILASPPIGAFFLFGCAREIARLHVKHKRGRLFQEYVKIILLLARLQQCAVLACVIKGQFQHQES